jgi:hypothetical protein
MKPLGLMMDEALGHLGYCEASRRWATTHVARAGEGAWVLGCLGVNLMGVNLADA